MLDVLITLIPLKTQLVPRSKHSISVLTRPAVHGNTDIHSCNHCCSGKAMSIIQPVCVFVALGIQHAMHMRHIVICDLRGSTIFFYINS
jgi:hypothetical protein